MKVVRTPPDFVEFTKKDQDYISAADSGVLCWIIYHGPLWGEKLSEWLTYVTGTAFAHREAMNIVGERIWNLERLFNMRAGLTGRTTRLPPRILNEPRVKNRVVPLDKLLVEYYEWRGWDENRCPDPGEVAGARIGEGRGGVI